MVARHVAEPGRSRKPPSAGRTGGSDQPDVSDSSAATQEQPGRADDQLPPGDRHHGRAAPHEAARQGPRSSAEWITLAISSLIVLGLFGVTTYFYLTGSELQAIVEVEPRLAETYQAGSRFYLPVTVRNDGGATGEEVRARVTLTDTTGRQETAEVTVQFLAGGGSSRAVVAFGSDPRQGQIDAVVMSYLEP
jgi:uncharacterized protein (TIGR02588 family)